MILTIVKVHVNVLRRRLLQLTSKVILLIVERHIKPQLLDQPSALLIAPRNTHDPRTTDLGNLARHTPRRARRARYNHRLTRSRVANLRHAVPRRHARQPQRREHVLRLPESRVLRRGFKAALGEDGVLRPAGGCVDVVALGDETRARGQDAASAGAVHDGADLHGGHVRAAVCFSFLASMRILPSGKEYVPFSCPRRAGSRDR